MRVLPLVLSFVVFTVACAAARGTPSDAMRAADAATTNYANCSNMAGLQYKAAIQRDMGVSEAETLVSIQAALAGTADAKQAAMIARNIVDIVHVKQNVRASAAHIAAEYMRTCVWGSE